VDGRWAIKDGGEPRRLLENFSQNPALIADEPVAFFRDGGGEVLQTISQVEVERARLVVEYAKGAQPAARLRDDRRAGAEPNAVGALHLGVIAPLGVQMSVLKPEKLLTQHGDLGCIDIILKWAFRLAAPHSAGLHDYDVRLHRAKQRFGKATCAQCDRAQSVEMQKTRRISPPRDQGVIVHAKLRLWFSLRGHGPFGSSAKRQARTVHSGPLIAFASPSLRLIARF
jgi:hypothetical protein